MRKIQCKDIADDFITDLIVLLHEVEGHAFSQDIRRCMPNTPPKVVMAKLRKMERRGLISGCACGCSGVWFVV